MKLDKLSAKKIWMTSFQWLLKSVLIFIILPSQAQVSSQTPGWYPFPSNALDSLEGSPVDVSFLNKGGAKSRISVEGAYFVNEQRERIKFLGTNVSFSGAFPKKKYAPTIAKKMAQLGMNVVRFHHMDMRDIWLPGKTELDPQKLDRLDWFIYHLKLNGIYSNINLHVSRSYPGHQILDPQRQFKYGKIIDNFYEPYIRLQQKYSKDLLGHLNPYTKLSMADDPAIAFVEINNENTLLKLNPALLDDMPKPYRSALTKQWQTWLTNHFDSVSEIRKTWNENSEPLGKELIRNNNFENNLDEWKVECPSIVICKVGVVNLDENKRATKFQMMKQGNVSWAYQFHQFSVPIKAPKKYTLKFKAKANSLRKIRTALRLAQSPWSSFGMSGDFKLNKKWQEFTAVSLVRENKLQQELRLSFNLGDNPGTVWITDVSLRAGNKPLGLDSINKIEEIPIPDTTWPSSAWVDFRRFLIETEQLYVKRMKEYLINKIGVKSLIIDSQANWGGYWGLYREASQSDYVDMHAYWQHPTFPGRAWDKSNWNIRNISMVGIDKNSTFERLTHYRLHNRPFSVSEYNHPAPNDQSAELFPMLSAYASYQDWDALYQFNYMSNESDIQTKKLTSHFNLVSHSGQLAFLPIAALTFRQALIPIAKRKTVLSIPLKKMEHELHHGFPSYKQLISQNNLSPQTLYNTRFSTKFDKESSEVSVNVSGPTTLGKSYINAEFFFWNPKDNSPVFTVNAPAVKMAIGDIVGKKLELGGLTIEINDKSLGSWAAIGVAAKDGLPITKSESALMSIVTRVENTNMGWNPERTTVNNNWGEAPVIAQIVPTTITLSGLKMPIVTPLSPTGKRLSPLNTIGEPGAWVIKTSVSSPSLWYIIER